MCKELGTDFSVPNFFLEFLFRRVTSKQTDFVVDFLHIYDIIKEKEFSKMKKEIYRIFRRARRNVARFIVGYDRCPVECRKNYNQLVFSGFKAVLLVVVFVSLFFMTGLFLS